ncbi:MAG: hypothetical protein RL637_808 [Pseudomonadota bacterium]|jgi:hypothetical protein
MTANYFVDSNILLFTDFAFKNIEKLGILEKYYHTPKNFIPLLFHDRTLKNKLKFSKTKFRYKNITILLY